MSTVNIKEPIWLCCVLSCTVRVVTYDLILSQEVILLCATDGLLTGANVMEVNLLRPTSHERYQLPAVKKTVSLTF